MGLHIRKIRGRAFKNLKCLSSESDGCSAAAKNRKIYLRAKICHGLYGTMPLEWEEVRNLYNRNPTSKTKRGKKFIVKRVLDNGLIIDLPSGEEYISREKLESAVDLIERGTQISGPADYRKLVYDQRPAYAWAILRDLGFIR